MNDAPCDRMIVAASRCYLAIRVPEGCYSCRYYTKDQHADKEYREEMWELLKKNSMPLEEDFG